MQLIRKKKISQLPLLESTTENTYVHVVDSDENYRIEADKITASLASKTYVDQQDALKVDKVDGKSLIADTEISRLAGVDNQTLSGLGGEPSANKQDSLAVDGTGTKFPTVDAVNLGLATKSEKTTQVVAGAGLTGGGTLESDRTLNVVSANDGITVNADNIQLNAVDNLASTSSTQPLSAKQGKELNDKKVEKVVGKQLSTEDYTTTEKSKVANVPLNTNTELAAKVDKVAGKSLILDTEITRLASVTNQTLSGLGGELVSNKKQTLTDSETDYPSGKAVKTAVDLKFDKDNLESVRSQSTSKVPSSKLVDDELSAINNIFANRNFSTLNRGIVAFNKTTGKLTISDSFFVAIDGRLGVIQGGSGTNLVTDFQTSIQGTGISIIYIDILTFGEIGTVDLKAESFTFVTQIESGKQRLVLGAGYYNAADATYYLTMPGVFENDVDRKIQLAYADIITNTLGIKSIKGESVVSGNDSTMSGANNWIADLRDSDLVDLTCDVNTTVAGKMVLNFTSGTNQAIKLPSKLVIGHSYIVKVKAKVNSGPGSMAIRLGSFFQTLLNNKVIEFIPTATETEFTGTIIAASVNVWLGSILGANNGSGFEFDDIQFFDLTELSLRALDYRLDILESTPTGTTVQSFHTDQFLESLSKYDKPLTKLGVVGDSLMANAIGGAIPVEFDEGVTKRPIRFVSNQIARRIYDLISWNKATHRRLDDADWTKSGTWATITSGLFEGAQDIYHTSSTANSYVEITIPNGKENFAFVCRRDAGLGVLNITLNGGNISTYGSSTVDLDRTKTGGSSDLGNAFHTVLYTGLPAGNNIIRISKENNTEEVQIWGGFYWTGNTLVVHNVAHGGHNLADLLGQHLQAEVVENDFDAILFELPLMNEAGQGTGTIAAQTNLQTIINTIIVGKDTCFMSCQPFGTDPTDGTPNYYSIYSDPSMEDYNTALRNTLFNHNQPFVDVFSFFKKKIENRGGTLETGEGGLWYTHDGQHQSESGMREYWNLIRFLFENKPIRY